MDDDPPPPRAVELAQQEGASVINNVQLKRLEEVVFSRDENALMIVENTFNVMGASFSRRRLY